MIQKNIHPPKWAINMSLCFTKAKRGKLFFFYQFCSLKYFRGKNPAFTSGMGKFS